MSFTRVAAFILLSSATACGAGHTEPLPRTSTSVISRSELDAAGGVTVYDAVLRLRPTFFRDRGQTSVLNGAAQRQAVVFVNDSEYGTIESLRQFPAARAQEVRYFTGPEATTKFGSAYGSGVILVKLRVQ